MKKFGKNMMKVLGVSAAGGMLYYALMPKNKKKEVCDKVRNIVKTKNDFMDDFY